MLQKILVIEAFSDIAEHYRVLLSEKFPKTPIVCMTKEEYEGNVIKTIEETQAAVIILGWGMKDWNNSVSGNSGLALLPFVRKALPKAMVIFTATAPNYLQVAIARGAHVVCEKGDLPEHFSAIQLHFDLLKEA